MEQIRLAIMDEDREYSFALGKAIALFYPEFLVAVYPAEAVKLHCHLILVSEEEWNRNRDQSIKTTTPPEEPNMREKKGLLLGLSKDPQVLDWKTEELSEKGLLYKYHAVSKLAAFLRILYGRLTGKENPCWYLKKPPLLMAFFSGAGGMGTTTFAIKTARRLAEEPKKRVLYVSLEELESTTVYFNIPKEERSMGDYLYYLLFSEKKEQLATFLSSFLFTEDSGVQVFYPSEGKNELRQLKEKDLFVFLSAISRFGHYDYIVFDLGNALWAGGAQILHYCKEAVLLTDGQPVTEYKNEMLLKSLEAIYEIKPENIKRKEVKFFDDAHTELRSVAYDGEGNYRNGETGNQQKAGTSIR